LGRWLDACRRPNHEFYSAFLPARVGAVSAFLRRRFFSGITFDPAQAGKLLQLPSDAIVVFVTKFTSYFEFLFYHTRFRENGHPCPELAMDYRILAWQPIGRLLKMLLARIVYFGHHLRLPDPYHSGYFEEKLTGGHAGLLSLVQRKGLFRRFKKNPTDPLQFLVEVQQRTHRPVVLVPLLMFYGKNPLRTVPSIVDILFGSEVKPGRLRKLAILFAHPGKIFLEVSTPVNLQDIVGRLECSNHTVEHQSLTLRRNLLVQINRHRHTITGPMIKSKEELKESILTGEALRQFMLQYAEKQEMPLHKVHLQADAYLDEIAAAYNPAAVRIMAGLVDWIINTMFEGVSYSKEELNRVKALAQKGPLIFIPCHRSHIDYLIQPYLLYANNMPSPHIAAGKNLSFWPMGPIFRSGGAFFLRRTFKGATLYSRIFSEYIRKLLEEGFNIEFFIEGGRSRTGKMILPKLGLLTTLVEAFRDGVCQDLILVPIFIGYDQVLEEQSYLSELEGAQKQDENFMQVIKAHRFLKKRYGRIYIKFHEPLILNDLLNKMGLNLATMTPVDQAALCRNLGFRIIKAINAVTVVTPYAVVAGALLNSQRKRFALDYILEVVETYLRYLNFLQAPLAETLMLDPAGATAKVMDTYVQRKFIERIPLGQAEDANEQVFCIIESRRPSLEYYKNNCIAYFVPAAFTAMGILERDAFQFTSSDTVETYRFLQEFFKDEFAYDVDRAPEFFVRKTIKAFIDEAIVIPHPTLPDTYNLTSAGFRKLKGYAFFLKSYFESYWIVLNYLIKKAQSGEGTKERLKRIETLGNRMYQNEEIDLKEALSKLNYTNALKFFAGRGINGSADPQAVSLYSEALQKYLHLLGS
jgi:glycerol-3-phosphate O-acyltransferase